MPHAAYETNKHARWTHGMALERQLGLPHGMLVSRASDVGTMIERALVGARLDRATRAFLADILTVTVRDWMRRKT
jgi:hypothetical protein